MKLIQSYIRRHLATFFTGLAFLALEAFADLMQPALMAHIVDEGVKQADVGMILHYGLMMFGIALLGAVGAIMRNLFASYTSQIVGMEMRGDMYRKIQSLSFENIDRLQPASIITRLTNDVTQIQDFVNSSMRIMIKAPMTCMGAVTLIIIQTPQQIPVMIVILVIVAALLISNMKIGYPRFGWVQKKLDRLNTVSQEFLSSVRVVKVFHAEALEQEKFDQASADLAEAATSAMQVMAIFTPFIHVTVNMGIIVLLWSSGPRNAGEIGRLMASINYMTQILFAAGMFSGILNRAVRAMASAERVAEILKEVPAQEAAQVVRAGVNAAGATEAAHTRFHGNLGAVEFDRVSFTYAGAGRESLREISFSVQAGETVGIIGPTGSGKSTLVNLIPRFYDADGGQVCIGGEDVRTIDESVLRAAIAVAPQKALLFTGTILENLCWGRQDAGAEEIRRAVETACADSFVDRMEQKYDTLLGQGGVNLSGGQKQRLSIARALLRQPKILILDDCTSALDAATESKVLEGLRQQVQGMTVFLISQRIATVMRADRILCMENGAVQGCGTHEELMETCSTYQAIYRSQIGGGAA